MQKYFKIIRRFIEDVRKRLMKITGGRTPYMQALENIGQATQNDVDILARYFLLYTLCRDNSGERIQDQIWRELVEQSVSGLGLFKAWLGSRYQVDGLEQYLGDFELIVDRYSDVMESD